MTIRRIRIRVGDGGIVVLSDHDDPGWRRERKLRWSEPGREGSYPLPPDGELPDPDEPHHALCAGTVEELDEVYQRIVERRPRVQDADVMRFGRYLFHALLGPELWRSLEERLEEDEELELALALEGDAASLHRFNWEMMHGPEGFLAGGTRPVVVTRLVADANAAPRPMATPPRVLFVLGASLTDPRVRPGAEYLGLLRRVDEEGRTLNARVVEAASPDRLRKTVTSFRPDVVYLVAHGGFERDGRPYLEFAPERGSAADRPEQRFGPQILDLLTAGGDVAPPSVVVLSACHTGHALLGAHRTSPLAVELVRGGVPVVVGMAGEVSDRACRHFTRRFGQVLTRGDRLLEAAERGRRAAFVDADLPGRSVDWAFPALFLSAGVAPDLRPAPLDGDDAALRMVEVMRHLNLTDTPVFCGRRRFFQAYEALLASEGPGVLAAYTGPGTEKLGRTRLLRELAAQALRDGHLPCVVMGRAGERLRFSGPLELGLEILEAVSRTREGLGLGPPPTDTGLLSLLRLRNASSDLDRLFREVEDPTLRFRLVVEHLSGLQEEDADPRLVRDGLRGDMEALVRDARELGPPWDEEDVRAVLLLDDIHDFAEPALDGLLDAMLGGFGLGTPGVPVPVVLTFALGHETGPVLKLHLERAPGWLHAEPVEPFDEEEHPLVWRRVLLHPSAASTVPGVSEVPLVPNPESEEARRRDFEENLWAVLEGNPSRFDDDFFFALVRVARQRDLLLEADDERKLAEMLRRGGS